MIRYLRYNSSHPTLHGIYSLFDNNRSKVVVLDCWISHKYKIRNRANQQIICSKINIWILFYSYFTLSYYFTGAYRESSPSTKMTWTFFQQLMLTRYLQRHVFILTPKFPIMYYQQPYISFLLSNCHIYLLRLIR